MRNIRISLVDLPATARAPALAAAQTAFPRANIVEAANAEEVIRREPSTDLELLVMTGSISTSTSGAIQAEDETGLPRWAVVVLGGNSPELAETVPPEEWNPRLLTRVFRSALLEHELLCENLRLRGDLKTIARRFSHDLVTPVGCINTSACVLRILPPEETQSMSAILQNIEDSAAEISELIERMSFVVRASADPGVPVAMEMGRVVADVLQQLEAGIGQAGATIVTPPTWPTVSGIEKWVSVIWWNLIGNAVRHGGAGGRVQLAWQAEGAEYLFSVSDNGPGVAPVVQPGLFRPFDQLHAVQTAGLGLSIVQRLTALQGGRCGYEKIPEGGASFSFTLPNANAEQN